jgi:hypothetical protein
MVQFSIRFLLTMQVLFWRLLPLNGFQTMAIGLVLSIEGLNTAVEKTCFIHQVMKKSVYKIYYCRSSFAATAIIIRLNHLHSKFHGYLLFKNGENNKKKNRQENNSKTKQVLGNNKTAQNRFGQPSYIIFGRFIGCIYIIYIHGQEGPKRCCQIDR